MYDGPGHAGQGTRSPDAASVSDGILTINGDGDGTTAGMAWGTPRSTAGGRAASKPQRARRPTTHSSSCGPPQKNFPVGGEIDFMEIMSQERDEVNVFLHYGEDNSQVQGKVEVDATEWHNWAVEWTPDGVTTFLDGEEWWKTTDTSILPPGPMHLCIQLDWFPEGKSDGGAGEMHVDWVKQWSYQDGDSASTDSEGSEGSTDEDSSTTLTDEQNNS
ncbi:glycoside hydrolase family 16 protein [Pseudonocardia sp. ICBG601]|uniref:glycoside hydrolase family 16 protein n=1 Tax=Pseudonocardia sp. ICBG601 TaxID=2846759 RepID=UPI0027E383A3|nr:glycoside hydrolase family 16 protein [Pseudonocardia sp. ICBG601]